MNRHPSRAVLLFSLAGSLALAACGGGGGGGGAPPPVDPLRSSFTVTPGFGTAADGREAIELALVLADAAGKPLPGRRVVLEATGFGNALAQPPATDGNGRTLGRLRTSVGERKRVTAIVDPGPDEVRFGPLVAEFLRILPGWRYVRTSGSDANDGTSPLRAWATLGHALAQLAPGQTLFVGAGTYSDPLLVTTVASAEAPLQIRGDRAGEFTGDAGEVLLDASGAAVGVELRGAAHVLLRGLSLRGSDPGVALLADGASQCALLDCRIYENGRGIELRDTRDFVLEANRISANSAEGVRLTGTTRTGIVDNLIYANGSAGVLLATPSSGLSIQFNTLFRNAGNQVHEVIGGSTGQIANNVIAEGTGLGLGLTPGSTLSAGTNLSWLNTGNTPASTYTADPLLSDPSGPDGILGGIGAEDDDFRVAVTSPTLDAGGLDADHVALSMGGSLGARGTRADERLDGELPDQARANLGFHVPAALDAFASLAPRGARLAFAPAGDARVSTRGWERDADRWAPAARTLALGREVRYLLQRVSPGPKPEEVCVLQLDAGVATRIEVRTWDGRRWSDDAAALRAALAAENADERGVDLEYEARSANAMLVHADGADNVAWRRLVEGEWSPPQPVFAPALATGTVLWTELVQRPGTDELALVALDDQQRLVAALWDGARWTDAALLATQVNSVRDYKAFDAAFEGQSGDLLVAWGFAPFVEETRYATLVRASATWTTGQFVNTDTLGKTVFLASDPLTDRIIGVFGEGASDDDVGVSVWNGATWSNTAELALKGHPESRAMEVGWFGTNGLGFALYRDQAQTGAFQWALLNSVGWRRQAEVFLPGVAPLVQAEARAVPGTDRALLVLLDEAGALWAVEHNGTAWVLANGGLPLATGLDPTNPGRSFDFDLRAL